MKISFVSDIHEGLGEDAKNKSLPAGSAQWIRNEAGSVRSLAFTCPCGCGDISGIPIAPAERGWNWNGNEELPTLAPSIAKTGSGCHWHGYLTNGVWQRC